MRQFLNGNTLANDVRMRRSVWKVAFLFVEGDSDERLYSIFVDSRTCQVIVSHGRANLIEACEILSAHGFKGFLGIIDADLCHAQGTLPLIPNILVTDFHDAECFMLRGTAFERVLREFASKEKLEYWHKVFGPDVRKHLLSHSIKVGFLLWHSTVKGLNLIFSNLEVKEFADRESLEIDVRRLVEHTKHKSQKQDLNSAELVSEIGKLESFKPEPWQVVRGSDFIDLMGYALRHALATLPALEVSRERLEQSLRLAYSTEEFAATELFRSIKIWEKANSPFVVLKVIATGTLFDT